MTFESFIRKGTERAKKSARIGVAGLAMTGGPTTVPIPAEIAGLEKAAITKLQEHLPSLRGSIPEEESHRRRADVDTPAENMELRRE
jgi:hypothetical protein